jgi:fructose-1,6-bisphosphatase I
MKEACGIPTVISLNYHLRKHGAPDHLRHLITDIARAGKYIVQKLWHGTTGKAGSQNHFGEEQVALDVLSNDILEQHLCENELVACYASEERGSIVDLHDGAPYTVVFDPLDGSSLVDANFSVGTIVGVYEAGEVIGKTPREQVAALYILYGPRTMLVYTLGNGKGVHRFVLNDVGDFVIDQEFLGVGDNAKIYAPGNISAAAESIAYKHLMTQWIAEKKTLRYSGCMVSDIHHILAKGNGVFVNLGGAKYPDGKLRLLYECGPFAYIIEEAGGSSSDGVASVLDKKIDTLDQRTQIVIGSRNEVLRVEKALKEVN